MYYFDNEVISTCLLVKRAVLRYTSLKLFCLLDLNVSDIVFFRLKVYLIYFWEQALDGQNKVIRVESIIHYNL